MGIAGSRRDIGVSEQPLRHLDVANGSRHASGRRVAQIVEAEVVYARFLLCLGPFARPPANAERIAFTADAGRAVAPLWRGALADIGKDTRANLRSVRADGDPAGRFASGFSLLFRYGLQSGRAPGRASGCESG